MARYRKKSVEIDAVQWMGTGDALAFFAAYDAPIEHDGNNLAVTTLEGVMIARIGDWIIRGVKGEFYPCKPDIFAATYDPCE